ERTQGGQFLCLAVAQRALLLFLRQGREPGPGLLVEGGLVLGAFLLGLRGERLLVLLGEGVLPGRVALSPPGTVRGARPGRCRLRLGGSCRRYGRVVLRSPALFARRGFPVVYLRRRALPAGLRSGLRGGASPGPCPVACPIRRGA